jgi:TM2 domain-containing membrane protein YozV
MKNKFAAAVLAIFFGVFGAHKFYLRDPGAGIFYIMLTMMTSVLKFPLGAILGFIDGLRYLMMSQKEFDKKFNSKYFKSRQRKYQRKKTLQHEYYETKKTKNKTKRSVRNNPFKKSGIKKYKDYDIQEAILDFEKGIKLEPHDISLHFNMASAYSLLENKEAAYKYLAKAVELGFKDFDKIETHDDLAFLRIQDDFDGFRKSGFRNVNGTQSNQTGQKQTSTQQGEPMDDVLLSQLNRLMELRKKGVLTENEYLVERKKILIKQ